MFQIFQLASSFNFKHFLGNVNGFSLLCRLLLGYRHSCFNLTGRCSETHSSAMNSFYDLDCIGWLFLLSFCNNLYLEPLHVRSILAFSSSCYFQCLNIVRYENLCALKIHMRTTDNIINTIPSVKNL